ncbi:hypothetical protein CAPTEDRAFT_226810 [Capitella teleta]|uniref:EF-hand domain-containing protein n=1 Tax=Capitella teleta TaxID=283909 RepID=R7TYX4_CAPTE|nr:hypothetical protein CAPTEDRAFT_226810 [Capitella teleta]|eukprot:ELT96626.1 hypothetical protein CAPTEDRAFT_226810 [Capitella teleta]
MDTLPRPRCVQINFDQRIFVASTANDLRGLTVWLIKRSQIAHDRLSYHVTSLYINEQTCRNPARKEHVMASRRTPIPVGKVLNAFQSGPTNTCLSRCLDGGQLTSIEFMQMWCHYDKDKSGYLDKNEMGRILNDMIRMKTGRAPSPDSLAQLRNDVMSSIDVNKDGKIELAEFSKLLPVEENFMLRFNTRKTVSRDDFNAIFQHYDPDFNECIEGEELLALIRDLLTKSGKKKITLQELEDYRAAVFKVYDKNSDRRLSRKELALLLSTTT